MAAWELGQPAGSFRSLTLAGTDLGCLGNPVFFIAERGRGVDHLPPVMKFIKLLKITDAITLANVVLALLAIFCALHGKLNTAAGLMLVSVFFDYSDGAWSQRLNIANHFGRELDSLADVICFGVTPVLFVFSIYHDARYFPVYALFLAAGVLRLARHNTVAPNGYFEGMPITLNGLFIPVLYLCDAHALITHGYMTIAAFFMLSSIRVPKLRLGAKKEQAS